MVMPDRYFGNADVTVITMYKILLSVKPVSHGIVHFWEITCLWDEVDIEVEVVEVEVFIVTIQSIVRCRLEQPTDAQEDRI